MNMQRNTSLKKQSLTELPVTPSHGFLTKVTEDDLEDDDTIKIAAIRLRPTATTAERPTTVAAEHPSSVVAERPTGSTERPSSVVAERPTIVATEHPIVAAFERSTPVASQIPAAVAVERPATFTDEKSRTWAYRLLWFTFILFITGTGVGKLWDRVWHLTHVFDTFWSPPHIFVSSMTAVTGFLAITLAFVPYFRSHFGPFIRVPFLKVEVAGSLIFLGGGLTTLSLSIMLDLFWHTTFGFDETQWSLPHNMIVMSWFMIILGFVSCRLAFRESRPMNWLTNIVLALLILAFLWPAILGPFYLNYTPGLLHTVANRPVNRVQPPVRHLYRIYFAVGLSRQQFFAFIPFATFAAGLALGLLRRLDKRASVFLLAPVAWSLIFMVRDCYTVLFLHYEGVTKLKELFPVLLREPAIWYPIPLVPIMLIDYVLARKGWLNVWTKLLNGAIFAFLTYCIWHDTPLMLLLIIPAAPLILLGDSIGTWIYGVLEKPRWSDIVVLLLTACSELPAFFGVVDLILRTTIH